jgi:hypothetical protein
MGVRIDAAGQNKKTRGINNRVPLGFNVCAHLTYHAAFNEHVRLFRTVSGDNGAILNQDSHTSLRTVQQ